MKRLLLSLIAAGALALPLGSAVRAADHTDAPGTKTPEGERADITDVYLFKRDGKLVGAIDFAGTPDPNPREDKERLSYGLDRDVLFVYHIDNAGTFSDAKPEIDVKVRFAQDELGNWGVQFENVPGMSKKFLSGPVETVLQDPGSGLRAYAGVRDDPFFFDFVGFNEFEASISKTVPNQGDLTKFKNTRDSFGHRNITTIVFEMDPATATAGAPAIQAWATAGRKM